MSDPVALLGIAEKGFVSIELSVESEGGLSSMPPPHTSGGILSKAISKLEDNQMPGSIRGPIGQMLEYLGPEMSFDKRLIFANLWLFRPLVERQLSMAPSTNAAIRTTTAVTMIEGGVKENVLPAKVRAVINFRILPGDSIQSVIDHIGETIGDPRVKVARYGEIASEPSAVSDMEATGYQLLQRTIRQIFPGVLVASSQVLGATDSRHYARVSSSIYRFAPTLMRPEDLKRFHGTDERISVDNYMHCVYFYRQLIINSAQ